MRKPFFLLAFLLAGQIMFSQSVQVRTNPWEDPGYQAFERSSKATHRTESRTEYFSFEETLKSFFIDGVIPKETPRATLLISREEYIKLLNDWITKNKNYLKPEHKNSLIN